MEFYFIFAYTVFICLNKGKTADSLQKKISCQINLSGTMAVTYTIWGRLDCDGGNNTETVYTGYVGGSRHSDKGAAVDYLCMPEHPEGNGKMPRLSLGNGYLIGAKYRIRKQKIVGTLDASYNYHTVPCAVCRTIGFANVLMVPGKSKCMPTWTKLYSGYLMTGNYKDEAASQYICLDGKAEKIPGSTGGRFGKKLFPVSLEGGAIPCPPYKSHQAVACVMTINSQKLYDVQERLERILTEKKSLNSKVTADAYGHFKDTIVKGKSRNANEVKSSLRKLELSLKNEGFYKNVKGGFEAAKNEILEIIEDPEFLKEKTKAASKTAGPKPVVSRTYQGPGAKQSNPRAVTVTLSNTYARQHARQRGHPPTIQRPIIEPDAPPMVRTRKPPIVESNRRTSLATSSPEELATLNQTIHRLFTHLEIDKANPEAGTTKAQQGRRAQRARAQKNRSPSPVRGHHRNEAEFKELAEKLKRFEDAFQRKREVENEEILSLQAQVGKLKSQQTELTRELERHRGTHSIVNKAKGKLIEERYQEERKGMEMRIHELEEDIKKTHGGAESDSTLKADLIKLANEIEKLSHVTFTSELVHARPKYRNQTGRYDVTELIKTLDVVSNELKSLRDSKYSMETNLDSMTLWKQRYQEMEVVIEKFYTDVTSVAKGKDSEVFQTSPRSPRESRSRLSATPLRLKLQKTKTLLTNYSQKLEDAESALKERTRMYDEDHGELSRLREAVDTAYSELNVGENNVDAYDKDKANSSQKDSKLSSMDKILQIRRSIARYPRSKEKSDLYTKSLEKDLETLHDRILRFDTGITSGLSDDNVHGDTPTPRDAHQFSFVADDRSSLSDKCQSTMKKIDVLQIGFLQIKEQNRDLVHVSSNLKKMSETLGRVRDELTLLCKGVGLRPTTPKTGDMSHSDVIDDIKLCRFAVEKKDKETNSKEGIIQKTYGDLERLKESVHKLWEYSNSLRREKSANGDSEVSKVPTVLEKVDVIRKVINKQHHSQIAAERFLEEKDQLLLQKERDSNRLVEKLQKDALTREKEIEEFREDIERLSSLAANALQDSNPSITNLGDPNRPTKIAEYFAELYDNEWTNAFETLTTSFYMEEKSAITCLLDIARECYDFCKSLADGQLQDIYKVLFMLYKDDSSASSILKEKIYGLSKQELKTLRDIRRSIAPKAQSSVFKILHDDDGRTSVTNERLRSCGPYIEKCVELCWLMQVQDPPLHLNWTVQSGGKVDVSMYRFYTQSGTYVEYLVWPSLHLFKDGHLLSKGVVQAI
ncbi:hypothetical protein FSP39_024450 [Pinctada imbricata]|uniref:Mitochondria-eating protein C-terminal domain-containing protein n=1 Tax=Pinctada imbricata TaxID=66713 RepID=A0AA88YK14_PINIB|nr:hypothetical protein FSP39_024450 [Pinctada imbricata]